jgi:hypothetical protein
MHLDRMAAPGRRKQLQQRSDSCSKGDLMPAMCPSPSPYSLPSPIKTRQSRAWLRHPAAPSSSAIGPTQCLLPPPPFPLVNPHVVNPEKNFLSPLRQLFEPVRHGRVEDEIHGRRGQEKAAGLSRHAREDELTVDEPADGGLMPLQRKHVVVKREVDGLSAAGNVGVYALQLVPS